MKEDAQVVTDNNEAYYTDLLDESKSFIKKREREEGNRESEKKGTERVKNQTMVFNLSVLHSNSPPSLSLFVILILH